MQMYTFSHANIMHISKEIIVLKDILSILSFSTYKTSGYKFSWLKD